MKEPGKVFPSGMSCNNNFTELPWDQGVSVTAAELLAIAASMQEFQLGESSEGRNLISAARSYVRETGDIAYVESVRLFIAEENRHARDLGRFLNLAGVPCKKNDWSDAVFRWLRRGSGLETSISVLLTAEVIAKVYYAALREATKSPLLRGLCDQILKDEAHHVRFQTERIAHLRKKRHTFLVRLCELSQICLMFGTILVVWYKHGRAITKGGYSFSRFWTAIWHEMREALHDMHPLKLHCEQLAGQR